MKYGDGYWLSMIFSLPEASSTAIIFGSKIILFIALTLLWVNTTPLGNPVVPLENGRIATSLLLLLTSFKQSVLIPRSSANSANFIVPSGRPSLSMSITGMFFCSSLRACTMFGYESFDATIALHSISSS